MTKGIKRCKCEGVIFSERKNDVRVGCQGAKMVKK